MRTLLRSLILLTAVLCGPVCAQTYEKNVQYYRTHEWKLQSDHNIKTPSGQVCFAGMLPTLMSWTSGPFIGVQRSWSGACLDDRTKRAFGPGVMTVTLTLRDGSPFEVARNHMVLDKNGGVLTKEEAGAVMTQTDAAWAKSGKMPSTMDKIGAMIGLLVFGWMLWKLGCPLVRWLHFAFVRHPVEPHLPSTPMTALDRPAFRGALVANQAGIERQGLLRRWFTPKFVHQNALDHATAVKQALSADRDIITEAVQRERKLAELNDLRHQLDTEIDRQRRARG